MCHQTGLPNLKVEGHPSYQLKLKKGYLAEMTKYARENCFYRLPKNINKGYENLVKTSSSKNSWFLNEFLQTAVAAGLAMLGITIATRHFGFGKIFGLRSLLKTQTNYLIRKKKKKMATLKKRFIIIER